MTAPADVFQPALELAELGVDDGLERGLAPHRLHASRVYERARTRASELRSPARTSDVRRAKRLRTHAGCQTRERALTASSSARASASPVPRSAAVRSVCAGRAPPSEPDRSGSARARTIPATALVACCRPRRCTS